MFAAALPFLGSAASAFGSYLGQEDTNETNRDIAEQTNYFNAQQAAMNRDFQERMSSSSWQRGVADMKKAGINPMLSVSQGGASSPSGGAASGTTGAPMQSSLGAGVSSAIQALNAIAQFDNLRAQTEMTRSQIPGKRAESGFSARIHDLYNKVFDGVTSGASSAYHYLAPKAVGWFNDDVKPYVGYARKRFF